MNFVIIRLLKNSRHAIFEVFFKFFRIYYGRYSVIIHIILKSAKLLNIFWKTCIRFFIIRKKKRQWSETSYLFKWREIKLLESGAYFPVASRHLKNCQPFFVFSLLAPLKYKRRLEPKRYALHYFCFCLFFFCFIISIWPPKNHLFKTSAYSAC